MMNMLEEAIIYATVLHQGKVRKFNGIPYILHPMEVAQILSTMTDDQEIITAGLLHDIVEDTDGTLAEIEKRFGKRVAAIVSSESEPKYPDEDPGATWKRRKEESLLALRNSTDNGVRMLWLADKLANMRSLARIYSERGAKGDVYRYDDELVIKVYNQNNTYHDVDQEIALSRKAFILGIPTAISFGIVSVGERYGSMYELVDSETLSACIARSPGQVETYAKMMADLAHMIHDIEADESDFPDGAERLRAYVRGGLDYEDASLAHRVLKLIDALPPTNHLIHGDFHTSNVFLQKGGTASDRHGQSIQVPSDRRDRRSVLFLRRAGGG